MYFRYMSETDIGTRLFDRKIEVTGLFIWSTREIYLTLLSLSILTAF